MTLYLGNTCLPVVNDSLPVSLAPECDGGHGEGLHTGRTPAAGWQPGCGQEQDH